MSIRTVHQPVGTTTVHKNTGLVRGGAVRLSPLNLQLFNERYDCDFSNLPAYSPLINAGVELEPGSQPGL